MSDATFLTRVVIENYKSIAACDVRLGPLTFLVGPNGSGKSNFLDALRFVSDALNHSLAHALRNRGGGPQICHAPHLKDGAFGIRLEFSLPNGDTGHYAIRIGTLEGGLPHRWEILDEECVVQAAQGNPPGSTRFHLRHDDDPGSASEARGRIIYDRLHLMTVASNAAFRPVYDALSRMQFYQIQPRSVEDVETADFTEFLKPDGSNLASVLFRLGMPDESAKERIEEYLGIILPGLARVRVEPVFKDGANEVPGSNKMALLFEQIWPGRGVHLFLASQMSEGTLRALGILTALLQATTRNGPRPSLVAIEEPEAQVHPAVLGVLREAMIEASSGTQTLVTTHSADLLDDKEVDSSWLLAVAAEDGVTRIGPIDEADRSVLRERLFTAGELLRVGQLTPAPSAQTNGSPFEARSHEEAEKR